MLAVHATHYRPLTLGPQEHIETQGKCFAQEFRQKTNIMVNRELNVLRQPAE